MLSMMKPPDPGTPPLQYRIEQEKLKKILSEDYSDDSTVVDFNDETSAKKKTTRRKSVKKEKTYELSKDLVTIENDVLAIDFYVTDFCETELAIIFVLDVDEFKVTPKKDSKFNLSYKGNTHPVYYIGRPVFFPKYNLHQIIFIKDLDAQADD